MPTNADNLRSTIYIPADVTYRQAEWDKAWAQAQAEAAAIATSQAEARKILSDQIRREQDLLGDLSKNLATAMKDYSRSGSGGSGNDDALRLLGIEATISGIENSASQQSADRALTARQMEQRKWDVPPEASRTISTTLSGVASTLPRGSSTDFMEAQLNKNLPALKTTFDVLRGDEQRRAAASELRGRLREIGVPDDMAARVTESASGVPAGLSSPDRFSADRDQAVADSTAGTAAGSGFLPHVRQRARSLEMDILDEAASAPDKESETLVTMREALASPVWTQASTALSTTGSLSDLPADQKEAWDALRAGYSTLSASERKQIPPDVVRLLSPEHLSQVADVASSRSRLSTLQAQLEDSPSGVVPSDVVARRAEAIYAPAQVAVDKPFRADSQALGEAKQKAMTDTIQVIMAQKADPDRTALEAAVRAAIQRAASSKQVGAIPEAVTAFHQITVGDPAKRKEILTEATKYARSVGGSSPEAIQAAKAEFLDRFFDVDLAHKKGAVLPAPVSTDSPTQSEQDKATRKAARAAKKAEKEAKDPRTPDPGQNFNF